jgi:hypothetical protein
MNHRVNFTEQLVWFTIFIAFISFQSISAQEETIIIEAGQSVADVLPQNEMYRYPEFIKSVVHYKDSTTMMATLNYNIALAEMMLISNRKDTLVIANRDVIDFIAIENDTFYTSDQGYFGLLEGNKNIKLLMKQYLKLTDIRKEGAYSASTSTSAIDNYSSTSANLNTSTYRLKVEQDMVYTLKTDYYFRKQNGELLLAKKNNLIRMFPEYKVTINKFLKENSISFNQKEDLIRLAVFLANPK